MSKTPTEADWKEACDAAKKRLIGPTTVLRTHQLNAQAAFRLIGRQSIYAENADGGIEEFLEDEKRIVMSDEKKPCRWYYSVLCNYVRDEMKTRDIEIPDRSETLQQYVDMVLQDSVKGREI